MILLGTNKNSHSDEENCCNAVYVFKPWEMLSHVKMSNRVNLRIDCVHNYNYTAASINLILLKHSVSFKQSLLLPLPVIEGINFTPNTGSRN
jgi:hypothetical protein